VDEAEAIAVVAEHDPGAYGFTMRTPANGLLHRVLPLRDPEQPRLWCVVVVRCSPGGLPDRSEGAWIGARGLRRDELAETLGAIRSDLAAWLAEDAQARLREWVLATPEAAATPALSATEVVDVAGHMPDHERSAAG
jgi:hypothetical protein